MDEYAAAKELIGYIGIAWIGLNIGAAAVKIRAFRSLNKYGKEERDYCFHLLTRPYPFDVIGRIISYSEWMEREETMRREGRVMEIPEARERYFASRT